MNNLTPKVAVAGCGYWGRNLIRNFHHLGALEAVCDTDPARARTEAETHGVRVASYDELLADPGIAGMVIAAPAAQHYELSKRALLAGKDVFVEKPIALEVEQGQELARMASARRRILMVGHLLLYHPAIHELKRLIQSGELGRIQYIYSSRLNWGKLRTEENILWSFAPHDISAVLFLLNEDPAVVGARGASYLNPRVHDVTLSTLQFESGVEAHIFVSWLHPFKEQRMVVVGTQKAAVFDDASTDRKLVLYPHRVDWVDRVPIAQKSGGEALALCADEPLKLECAHFLECIESRSEPRTDGESAVRVLRILEACDRSLRDSGKPVPLNPPKPKYFVHPSAIVDQPCEIGEATRVWHFSHIMERSKIGRHCILGQNVHVAPGVSIGNNVKIQNNVSLYTGVELEDDVFCGPSAVFTNVINPRSHIERKNEYRRTLVKRGASLGANSTVVCGVTIGEYAFIAAGAVVTSDVPPYALTMGVPARQAGWMCQCGARLTLTQGSGICASCGSRYEMNGDCLSQVALQAAAS